MIFSVKLLKFPANCMLHLVTVRIFINTNMHIYLYKQIYTYEYYEASVIMPPGFCVSQYFLLFSRGKNTTITLLAHTYIYTHTHSLTLFFSSHSLPCKFIDTRTLTPHDCVDTGNGMICVYTIYMYS